jgi:aspartyl-tRNA(Asn)/glutamyl-tRNA(Gln) amidotransferase subunit A
MSPDLTRLLAHEMAARLRSGEVSSRELVAAHLDVAERQNHALNAWLTIDRERALAEADAADVRISAARVEGKAAVESLHPLVGTPVALKDLVSVEGGQCTAGSRILEGYVAPYDAHITERLRDAGAVILGKTNMDEFAMGSSTEHSAFGPTSNPWDLDRVPGGSSGGSAAAVAAYHVPFGIGTDTGGSIRQPAALTGIVGMKPTYGRVSRYGIVAFASSLDQIGPLARDSRDAAALLHAVSGRDARVSTSAPIPVPDDLLALPAGDDEAAASLKGKRLGLPKEYFVAGMEPGVETAVRAAVTALEGAGATVEEVSLPHTDYGLATY